MIDWTLIGHIMLAVFLMQVISYGLIFTGPSIVKWVRAVIDGVRNFSLHTALPPPPYDYTSCVSCGQHYDDCKCE